MSGTTVTYVFVASCEFLLLKTDNSLFLQCTILYIIVFAFCIVISAK